MIKETLRWLEMLTPAQMAQLDIAKAERELYDLRNTKDRVAGAIDTLEQQISRLKQQYPQQKPFPTLPTIAPQPSAAVGFVRQFIGRGVRK